MQSRALIVAILPLVTVLGGCVGSVTEPIPDAETPTPLPDGRWSGNVVMTGTSEIPQRVTDLLRPFENVRSVGVFGWVGDGLLIGTRFAETTQVHRVREPLGAREQVTFFSEPVAAVAADGDERHFLYLKDVGGSEFYQIHRYDWASSRSMLLSDGRSRYTGLIWSRAGDRFGYSTTERNGANVDLHLQTLDGRSKVLLESDSGSWSILDWSPDDSHLLVYNYISVNESYIYELELATGGLTPLIDRDLKVAVGSAAYGELAEVVYFTSDMGAEFRRLHRLNTVTGELEVLTGSIAWDVESFWVSPDGATLVYTVNEGGYSRLNAWRLPERSLIALPEIPAGIIGLAKFSPDSNKLAFTLASPVAPSEAYVLDLEERRLERWTRSENGGLGAETAIAPEAITYPTFDEHNGTTRRIPAFIYRPQRPGPHPVLINIHGGPESQYRPYFSPFTQLLAREMGVALIAPNVRGSRGYGKSYLKLDNGFKREDSVRDIGALLDWIADQPDLDEHRVAVLGGSYGGYMVLASLVHYSNRLAAAVERVGISNFVTFLRNTQAYRRDLRRAEYGDERDLAMHDFLQSASPLNHVQQMQRPLMISQGYNDPRVPASESAQLVAALEDRDIPAWYLVATDEGHGFRKKRNRDLQTRLTWLFLEQHLIPRR
ncbi:MAG: alpha/beta fold hydrolase [Pseudomonadales bacterium]|nr:alpha/beta fold hydrolase [Pseudomonadales bacterium]MDP6469506.1 alpha/beta fold hydrolase [Pseudomonadales bacterium]MDP6827348.1 alpha/beta fold hydrolase [Pseudomonadales bacterium]MDP6971170.1 alpha/beta fold hydrolase [Pseudomonadales bacterium]